MSTFYFIWLFHSARSRFTSVHRRFRRTQLEKTVLLLELVGSKKRGNRYLLGICYFQRHESPKTNKNLNFSPSLLCFSFINLCAKLGELGLLFCFILLKVSELDRSSLVEVVKRIETGFERVNLNIAQRRQRCFRPPSSRKRSPRKEKNKHRRLDRDRVKKWRKHSVSGRQVSEDVGKSLSGRVKPLISTRG